MRKGFKYNYSLYNFTFIKKYLVNCFLYFILINNYKNVVAQTYYISGNFFLYELQSNNSSCGCDYSTIGPLNYNASGSTFGPDGTLYVFQGLTIYQVDIVTAQFSIVFTGPSSLPDMGGIVCTAKWNILYNAIKY
jgi:hypothetical protein